MFDELRQEIKKIKERNTRVEVEKAWETSKFRILCVATLTYLMIALLMHVIGVEKPYIAALVPTAGFLISTLSLQFAKRVWIKYFYKTN